MLRRPVADNTFPLLRQACQTRRKSIISHRAYCVIWLSVNIIMQRRLWELVIFSFAIDRLVKSCGKASPVAALSIYITKICKDARWLTILFLCLDRLVKRDGKV